MLLRGVFLWEFWVGVGSFILLGCCGLLWLGLLCSFCFFLLGVSIVYFLYT
jgi:hypothetical protein